MSEAQSHKQYGLGALIALAVITLVIGAAGAYWATSAMLADSADSNASQAASTNGKAKLYTCGMHPQVIQAGPGNCPMCGMKLTPLKSDDDAESDDGPQERKVLYWRAPMDPSYISDKPGKSPMGMDLVPVYADADQSSAGHTIRINPVTIQNMGIRTTVIERGPLAKIIRTVGRVDYDEQLVTHFHTRFEGWIEKLYVDETGQRVEKGQPLFEVYSPELYSAQQEYRTAVDALPRMQQSNFQPAKEEAQRLVEAARLKLMYLGVPEAQIDQFADAAEAPRTLTITSPADGIVTDKPAVEGMYVKPGTKLFTIADLSHVWVYVDIYEYQLPWVHVGQQATITLPYIPGINFTGLVVYVYPYLQEQTRVIQVRLEFANPTGELKPGMFANVTLTAELQRDALLIPREAYLDSGTRKVAFVDLGDGKFSPRDIETGVEGEHGLVEVLYGLDEGEVVVTSGQFLLDAESKLKEAVAKMRKAERADTTKRRRSRSDRGTQTQSSDKLDSEHGQHAGNGIEPDAAYACPMDTHPDEDDPANQGPYFSTEPGKCPLCEMKLKPLDELDWVRLRRAAAGGDVAYTCPDHQHVFSETADTCPRGGKELSPFKVMYTCPDPEHADVIAASVGNCPHCGRGLAAFRSIWLDESMAVANVPPDPSLADVAAFRCPIHPLVHSDRQGQCTICAAALESTLAVADEPAAPTIPASAKYTCPMQECKAFSESPGRCAKCGMRLKPIDQVGWARDLIAAAAEETPKIEFVCPMHPKAARSDAPGLCSICGMQMVSAGAFADPQSPPARIAQQMNFITEHYLELHRRFASDRTSDVAMHALGLASASEDLAKHLREPNSGYDSVVADAADKLHAAALKTNGQRIEADRVTFVELTAAMRTLVDHIRPDKKRWPTLYIFHCPMSKGDWLQTSSEMANPYYGFKMLKCGKLQGIK